MMRAIEMPTENESYHELWLKYYNIVVDILRAYNRITKETSNQSNNY